MYRVLNLIPENFILDYAQNFPEINKTVFPPDDTENIDKMAEDNMDKFKKKGFFDTRRNDLRNLYGTSDEEILAGFKAMATDTPTARNDFAVKYNKPTKFTVIWDTCKDLITDSLDRIFSNKVEDSEELIVQFAAALEDCRSSNSSSSSALNALIKRILKREFLYQSREESPFNTLQVFGITDSILDDIIKNTLYSRTVKEEFNKRYKKWNGEPFLMTGNDLDAYIKKLITNAIDYCKKNSDQNIGKEKTMTGRQFLENASKEKTDNVFMENFIEQILNLFFAEKMPKLSNFTADDVKAAKKKQSYTTDIKTKAKTALEELEKNKKEETSSKESQPASGSEASKQTS